MQIKQGGLHYFLLSVLCVALCACGGGGSNTDDNTDENTDEIVTPTTPTDPETPTEPEEPQQDPEPPAAPDNEGVNTEVPEVGIRFTLHVPEETPTNAEIYISGDFENDAWSGGGLAIYKAIQEENGRYTLNLPLDGNSTVQYYFTLGSWEETEGNAEGFWSPIRTTKVGNTLLNLDVFVDGWQGITEKSTQLNYWNTSLPDYSQSADRPSITLIGDSTVHLNIGETYEELGATATDSISGDSSADITVEHDINIARTGDYLVTYRVTNNRGVSAIPVNRIVRVYDDKPHPLTVRPVGTTSSHYGYAEHLPVNYGVDPTATYPLIIFNHGFGLNANVLRNTPITSLNSMVGAGGPTRAILMQQWDEDHPFIVLSPQRSQSNSVDTQRLNAFVDYAINNYQVDPNRIYMSGWSQGGFGTFLYAIDYPEKVAAIAPIAGGLYRGTPSNLCNISSVPIWAFHGQSDNVIAYDGSIGTLRAMSEVGRCGGSRERRTTIFPGITHPSHTGVYDLQSINMGNGRYNIYNPNIYDWFLSQ